MKHCTNCGLKIAQDVTTCPRCGAFVPYSPTAPLMAESSTSTVPAPPPYQGGRTDSETPQLDFAPLPSNKNTTPFSAYPIDQERDIYSKDGGTEPSMPAVRVEPQTPRYPTQPPQTPPYDVEQQAPLFLTPPPPPQSTAPFPADPMIAQQTPYGAPFPPQYVPYGTPFPQTHVPYPPQPQGRRGLSRSLLALFLILALLLISSGIGLIYYTTVARPAQLHAQATATAQTILTNDAHATTVANTQATGTAIAISNATATVQAQATAQAQATVTALQNIYTQATQGTPALNSSLMAQDSYNWDVNDTVDGGGCGFNGGTYHATLFSKNFYFPCFAHATNFSNFAFQVQVKVNQGDEGGLVFRSNSNTDLAEFYLFSIDQAGSYRLEVSKDQTHSTSIVEDTSTAIKTGIGQVNLLTVVAKGSALYLYINKQYVGSASDNSYSSGVLGVFASDVTANTDVSFSNAQVWTL